MTLTVDLSPELIKRLEEEAAARGIAAKDFAGQVLEKQLLGMLKRNAAGNARSDAWDVLESMEAVERPPDWSSELDHYLYGTPKRSSHLNE